MGMHSGAPMAQNPAKLPCLVGLSEGQSGQLATCPSVLFNGEHCHCSPGESGGDSKASMLLVL